MARSCFCHPVTWGNEAEDPALPRGTLANSIDVWITGETVFVHGDTASFGDLNLAVASEFALVDNFLWANDFPHHEGSWPYSAQAIERQMGRLDDGERAKILGLNAARIFGFDIPERYLDHPDAAALQAER